MDGMDRGTDLRLVAFDTGTSTPLLTKHATGGRRKQDGGELRWTCFQYTCIEA